MHADVATTQYVAQYIALMDEAAGQIGAVRRDKPPGAPRCDIQGRYPFMRPIVGRLGTDELVVDQARLHAVDQIDGVKAVFLDRDLGGEHLEMRQRDRILELEQKL